MRNHPALQRSVGTLKEEAAGGGSVKAGAVFSEGDVLSPKIGNVRVLAQPADDAAVVATLTKGDELVVVGAEKNGFINVQGSTATGWVKIALVSRR